MIYQGQLIVPQTHINIFAICCLATLFMVQQNIMYSACECVDTCNSSAAADSFSDRSRRLSMYSTRSSRVSTESNATENRAIFKKIYFCHIYIDVSLCTYIFVCNWLCAGIIMLFMRFVIVILLLPSRIIPQTYTQNLIPISFTSVGA